MDNAACEGHLNLVKFLHLNRSEGCDNALVSATEFCRFEVVKYLVRNGLGLNRIDEAIDTYREEDGERDVCLAINQYLREFIAKN